MRRVPGVGPGAVGVGTHTHTGKTPRQHREQKAATCRPRGEPEESAGGDGHGGRASGLWAEGGAAAASQADILVVAPSLPCVSFTFSVCGSVKLSLYGSRVVIFKNLDLQGLCHPGVMKMPVRRPARLSCCSWRCRCCRERNSFRSVLSLRFGSGHACAFWGRPLSAFHTHTNVKVISYV